MASGGGGKKTARSQAHARQQNDALRQYGYPSARELRREAQGLAGASVPTVREVRRPYTQQIQSSKDYLAAVRAALAETQGQVGSDYSQAVDQSQAVDSAAQARLAALGLGVDQAGTQAAVGARGDSATQNLIANAAAARGYAAQLPAVASGQATQFADVTRNKMLDALSQRRDSLSQAFFQALQQVQGQALQRAQFNQSSDQFSQNLQLQEQQMAQSASQFSASQSQSERQFRANFKAQYGYDPYTGGPSKKKGASLLGGKPSDIAKALGLSVSEVLGYQGQIVQGLSDSQGKHDVPVYGYIGTDGKKHTSVGVKPSADLLGNNKKVQVVGYQNYGGAAGAMTNDVQFPDAVQTARKMLPQVPFPLILSTVGAFYSANANPGTAAYWSYHNYLRAIQGKSPLPMTRFAPGPHDTGIG